MIRKDITDIINSIINYLTENNNNVTKESIVPGSVLLTLIEAISLEIDSLYEVSESIEKNSYLSTATGIYIDRIGEIIGCIRNENEDDETYKARIKEFIVSSKTCNEDSIKNAIESVSGVNSYILEPYKYGAGSFAVYITVSPGYDIDTVVESVRKAVSNVVASGVYFDVIKPKEVDVKISVTVFGNVEQNDIVNLKSLIYNYILNEEQEETMYKSKIIQYITNYSTSIRGAQINQILIDGYPVLTETFNFDKSEQPKITEININVVL